MNTKIQELTEKILKEGIEKGNAEATQIVDEAKAEQTKILKEARQEAEKILTDAKKKAEDLKKNTESELKLYAGQAISVLKAQITDMICGKLVDGGVKSATNNKEFMSSFLLTMAKEWGKRENIIIEGAEAEQLKAYFTAQAKDLLDKGIKIEQTNGRKASFSISPADGSYKISFGEEEFKGYFETFLRPQLIELLFS